jgi:hypothetical protein
VINKKEDILKSHENKIGVIALRKDNILTFTGGNTGATRTSIEILSADVEFFKAWTKESGPLPFLTDNRQLKQLSKEERIYIQSKVPIFASKFAMLVKGGLSTFFFNVMAHVNTPVIPMKAFTDIDKAFEWLKEK